MKRMLITVALRFIAFPNMGGTMKSVKFRLRAEPIAQGRPRLTTINGQARAFDPKKSRDWKAFVKDIAETAMLEYGHETPFEGPVVARMRFAFSLPKSHHRKRTPRPRQWHTKRPDVDNLSKGIFDACESVVFHNDTQIVRMVADKIICAQGEPPFVVVEFSQVEDITDSA